MKRKVQMISALLIVMIILYSIRDMLQGWAYAAVILLTSIVALYIAIIIFLENRSPRQTMTWMLVLAVNPLLGSIFYLVFGQSYRKKRMFAEKAIQDEQAFIGALGHQSTVADKPLEITGRRALLFKLAENLGKQPISYHTHTEVLTDGPEAFEAIIEAIGHAKSHIHLEYYIVRDDQLGRKIKDLLISKAREGIEVRFLYDSVGCWTLPASYIADLNQAGAKMVSFLPVTFPLFNNRNNFRNHRKIVVIDGEIGFVGGLNIGDEYLGKNEYFGYWRDTHLQLKGEAVSSLQLIFLQDWFYMTGEKLLDHSYFQTSFYQGAHLGGVQMVAAGPDHQWEVIKKLFFSMINSARSSIWIASPYFIPDEDILSALKVAALSGIDVRLLVPSKPDKRIVFYASRSYFSELLTTGVKIYTYRDGFMHSKLLLVDDEVASIGTSNMDMRSFHLSFEVNCFLYGAASIQKLVTNYESDLLRADLLEQETFNQRSWRSRITESLARLASPLL